MVAMVKPTMEYDYMVHIYIYYYGKTNYMEYGYPLVNKHSNGKWLFIVDFPIKNGDFPLLC
jgi:hypothetical protein